MKIAVEQLGRLELLEHAQPDLLELLLGAELVVERRMGRLEEGGYLLRRGFDQNGLLVFL